MEIRASSPRVQSILQAALEGRSASYFCGINDTELLAARCSSGCSALHWAAGGNQVAVVSYLVSLRGFDVNCQVTSRKAKDRTPLHYACRNGCLEAAQCLVDELGAAVNARAKHGVTPFQLAVWQNHLPICRWLVHDCGVDPGQVNDFGCGAVHWLGISPIRRADDYFVLDKDDGAAFDHHPVDDSSSPSRGSTAGYALLPLARWLASLPGINYGSKQRQGHTALHKASWLGHLCLVKYLHTQHDLWDDEPDDAGNYAADLADMAASDRHVAVAQYLRDFCSRERQSSCAILGLDVRDVERDNFPKMIRAAYKSKVRLAHPDKNGGQNDSTDFDALQKAYHHLMVHRGRGSQKNPAHSLKVMLEVSASSLDKRETTTADDDCFKARLIAVLLEYGDKGLDLSNLKKKWKQVWPNTLFPYDTTKNRGKLSLSQWIRYEAGDVVEIRLDGRGCLRVHAKNCSRANVENAVSIRT